MSGMSAMAGTEQNITADIYSNGRRTVINNPITAGSIYQITLDNQVISKSDYEKAVEEFSELSETVTEENVYSDAYIGKLLDLAGKGYFVHVDRENLIYYQIYDVAITRHLSMGMTGYEVRTSSMYGITVGLGEGSLYIDIDRDKHGAVSLNGNKEDVRQYLFATGMIASLVFSIVELFAFFAAGTIGAAPVFILGLFDMLFISQEMDAVIYAMDLYYRAMHGDEGAEKQLENYNAVKGTTIVIISMLFGILNKMLAREGSEVKVEEKPEGIHGESGSGSNNWQRNLQNIDELDIELFRKLKNNGTVKVNSSGSNRPLYGEPNSFYSTSNGEHVFVYDENVNLFMI